MAQSALFQLGHKPGTRHAARWMAATFMGTPKRRSEHCRKRLVHASRYEKNSYSRPLVLVLVLVLVKRHYLL